MENSNGYGVVTGELTGYAQSTRHIATELQALAARRVRSVRTVAEHGFGPIAMESGFAAALDHFAEALGQQVAGVAKHADALGDSVAKSAHSYQRQDDERAKDLLELIRGHKP